MNRMHGIIFAYEQRGELRELTERRTAASMPFGGRYRAVDFALSNLLNAGVTDVGMVLHGRYQSMLDHVGSGKVWDMSRKRGGLHLLPPFNYLHEWGVTPFRGKMEALAGVRDYLNEIRQDYVVLMEGDQTELNDFMGKCIQDAYKQTCLPDPQTARDSGSARTWLFEDEMPWNAESGSTGSAKE